MNKKFRVIVAIGVVSMLVWSMTACNIGSESADYIEESYFENVMAYQPQDLSDSISVSGTVESESSINVTSSVSAKVTKLNVSVGDVVKEGDILCTLDDSDIQKQIDDLETSIKNATALDENTKKLNRQALEDAKYDQTVQLKQAQDSIDEAKKNYDDTYKKYTDCIDKINQCVLEYNDTSNQIAQLENEMANQEEEYYSDDGYSDDDGSEGGYAAVERMSYILTDGKFNINNLSYSVDEYSTLVAKRDELSSKIEAYKDECSTYYDSLDGLKKAITTAEDNYTAVKRSTDQAIESAQNTVDMQDYQESSTSSTATQLENLKQQLEDCTVKSEKAGTITYLGISQGDTTTEGSLLMTIENTTQLKITVNIDEGDILKVKEGMNVIITSDATGSTEIQGKVSKVITIVSSNGNNSSASENGTNSSGFTAEITIDEDSDLLVGMKAKAKIMLVEKTDCYSVLYDCIMYDDGNPYVLVADNSNSDSGTEATVRRAYVTIGEESGSYIEVISDELVENDLIITTPYEVIEGDTLNLSPYVLDYGDIDIEVID